MATDQVIDSEKEQYWKSVIEEWQGSGIGLQKW